MSAMAWTMPLWQAALLADMRHEAELAGGEPLESVFFGGGTPIADAPGAGRRDCWRRLSSCGAFADGIEITLEGNPSSVEAANYAASGRRRDQPGFAGLAGAG